MWYFGKQKLKNIVHIEEAEFDYGFEGITKIIGRNLKSSRKKRTNGAGKSLLVSVLVSLLKNANPTHEKNKRETKNSLLDAGSEMSICLTDNDGTDYRLIKGKKGKAIYCRVESGKKDLGLTTNTKAEKFIDNLFPLTEEEIFSTMYLNTRRPDQIMFGTGVDRFKYLGRLFHLDDYDALLSEFKKFLSDLEKDRIRKETLIEQQEELGKIKNPKKIAARIEKLNKYVAKKQKELDKAVRDLEKVRTFSNHEQHIKLYDPDIKSMVSERKKLETIKEDLQKYKEYQKALNTYVSNKEHYSSIISKFKSKHNFRSVKEARAHNKKLEADRESLLTTIARLKTIVAADEKTRVTQKAIRKQLKGLSEGKKVKDKSAALKHLQLHEKHLRAFLSGSDSSTCTVCGSKFTRKSAKKRASSLSLEIEGLIKHQKKWRRWEKERTMVKELTIRLKELPAIDTGADKKLQKLNKKLRALPEPINIEKWSAAESELQRLEKPKKVKKVVEDSTLEKQIQKLTKSITISKTLKKSWSDIQDGKKICGELGLKKSVIGLEKRIDALKESVKCGNKELSDLDSKLGICLDTKKRHKKLEKNIAKVNRALEDQDVLEALVEAYNPKVLKSLAVQRLCGVIQKNLNRYSSTLFPESFKFELQVDQNSVVIMVERPTDRGNTKPVDVRHLSGAESVCFSLLWLISILPLIPDKRRTNILILDEIEAGLDETTKEMIHTEFLPALRTIVPHIIFITPYLDTDVHDSRTIVVQKDVNGIGSVFEEK